MVKAEKKQIPELTKTPEVEIVVRTYWPTRIIKSVTIRDTKRGSFKDEVTLSGSNAKYLFDQLKKIYDEATHDKR